MRVASPEFAQKSRRALADERLQAALKLLRANFGAARKATIERLPEFDALSRAGRALRDHVLADLDAYLERWEANAVAQGTVVHWARDAAEACEIVAALCREAGARTITKGKSMIAEEIGLNSYLESAGFEVVETDLGEYIIQLAGEPPSHIIVPAVHKTKEQVADLFRGHHGRYEKTRRLAAAPELVAEAREVLRERYFEAEVGITGANFLVAETGSSVIVTNEGNGDLTLGLPRMHIVLASIDKVVPTFDDAATLLRLLARSATGQDMSAYTTVCTGPRRAGDSDGPEAHHVVVLDNGRSTWLGTPMQEALRCIRCGACLNHCPIYGAVGGHAYGWVYPGPIGAVVTPALVGLASARHLPNASTFCGRCEAVCPMRIPLPKLMREWRRRDFETRLMPPRQRLALALWAWLALRPRLYRAAFGLAARILARGRRTLPFAGGWTRGRDLPASQGRSFHALWERRQ